THLRLRDDWVPVSGRVRLWVAGKLPDLHLHLGDEVEVTGWLARIGEPANPGEFDRAAHWRDQGVRAQLLVRKTANGVTRLERGWTGSLQGWLVWLRGRGQDVFRRTLSARSQGVAMALIL